jgi:hypothetical protein
VLSGYLQADALGDFGYYLPPVARALSIYARAEGGSFRRVGRATTAAVAPTGIPWRFAARPGRSTVYQARAWGEPRGSTVWRRASSRTVVVRVR